MAPLHRLVQALAALVLMALLAGCGGGSSVESPANRAPIATAALAPPVVAGTPVTLDGSASSDPDNDPLGFAWTLAAPPGSTATLSGAATARPVFTPDVPGTYTATLTASDGAASGTASVIVTVAAPPPVVPPAIALDQAEPLSGSVKLSLTGTVTGAVTWFADLRLLGSGNRADGHSVSWNTVGEANGPHQILAQIQRSGQPAIELRRTVVVSNSTVTLSATVSGTTGTIHVDARAASTFGISRVSASFDGTPFGSLTQPNACSRFCGGSNDVYRFVVDAAQAGSGPHTMVITAVDGGGGSRSLTVNVPVSNAPAWP
ncbi:MAG: PKD domain-containing protein [Betaproteobacteria bacterium]